jgi:hypothetical protein
MFFLLFLLDDRRIWILDPGGPKTYGSYGSGSGSATLVSILHPQILYAHLDLSAKEDGILVHAEGHEEGGGGGIGGRVRQRDLRHQQPDIKQIM